MFLNWITALVKAAVLKGFQEATEELELTHGPADDALLALKSRMDALPAPSGEHEGNGRARKAKTT